MKFCVIGNAGGGIQLVKLKSMRQCKRIWTAGEELVMSYGPIPSGSDVTADDGVGIKVATETSQPEDASKPEEERPKRGKKRPKAFTDFTDGARRRRTDAGTPRASVPQESPEVFTVESSDDE